tara:strand:- start:548 stop:652 length:105 start_codon:yes stop_codon:yes gene_type:complete
MEEILMVEKFLSDLEVVENYMVLVEMVVEVEDMK